MKVEDLDAISGRARPAALQLLEYVRDAIERGSRDEDKRRKPLKLGPTPQEHVAAAEARMRELDEKLEARKREALAPIEAAQKAMRAVVLDPLEHATEDARYDYNLLRPQVRRLAEAGEADRLRRAPRGNGGSVTGAIVPLCRREPIPDALYDRLAARHDRLLDEERALERRAAEIEREFLDGDLRVRSAPNRGKPLSRAQRLDRLQRYAELKIEARNNLHEQARTRAQVEG